MDSDTTSRVVRTIVQLIAGGGLTGVVSVLANGLGPSATATVMAVSTLLVTFCQNYAEDMGWIPRMMKPAPTRAAEPVAEADTYERWPETGA